MYQFSLPFQSNWPPFPLMLNFLTPHFYKSLDPIGSIFVRVLYPGTENLMKYTPPPPPPERTLHLCILYSNITEFGVVADHLRSAGSGGHLPPQTPWYYHTDHQTQVVCYNSYYMYKDLNLIFNQQKLRLSCRFSSK